MSNEIKFSFWSIRVLSKLELIASLLAFNKRSKSSNILVVQNLHWTLKREKLRRISNEESKKKTVEYTDSIHTFAVAWINCIVAKAGLVYQFISNWIWNVNLDLYRTDGSSMKRSIWAIKFCVCVCAHEQIYARLKAIAKWMDSVSLKWMQTCTHTRTHLLCRRCTKCVDIINVRHAWAGVS